MHCLKLFFHSQSSLYSPKIIKLQFMRSGVPPISQKLATTLTWLPAWFSTLSHQMESTSKVFWRAFHEGCVQCDGAYHIYAASSFATSLLLSAQLLFPKTGNAILHVALSLSMSHTSHSNLAETMLCLFFWTQASQGSFRDTKNRAHR